MSSAKIIPKGFRKNLDYSEDRIPYSMFLGDEDEEEVEEEEKKSEKEKGSVINSEIRRILGLSNERKIFPVNLSFLYCL